jgi:surfeit locus 1 family protein
MRPMTFRPTLWPTVFTIPAIIVMLCLAVWQVQRLQWKEAMITERVSRTTAAPIALPPAGGDLAAAEFRRISGTGTFQHDHEFYLAARSQNGNVGYWILTPFNLDGGDTLLVNRGWVPENMKAPASRSAGQVAGTVRLDGIIRLPQQKTWFQPENEADKNVWFYIDPAQMATAGGLAMRHDLYLDAGTPQDPGANPGGFPIGGQTRINLPNDHLQYAITWALLALALAAVYVIYHLKPVSERKFP